MLLSGSFPNFSTKLSHISSQFSGLVSNLIVLLKITILSVELCQSLVQKKKY